MSDVDRLAGQSPGRFIRPHEAHLTRPLFISASWVGGVVAAFAFGSLAAFWTAVPRSDERGAAAQQVPRLTLAVRSPVTRKTSWQREAGPLLTLGDETEADAERVAGPVLISDDPSPRLALDGPGGPIEGYASTATVPLARPLPLFRESDALPVVPPEGIVATATPPVAPIPAVTPATSAPATTSTARSTTTVTTSKAKKSRSDKGSTTTQVSILPPLVVPPEGLVVSAPGFVPPPPPTGATLVPASSPPTTTLPATPVPSTTLPSTTPGRPTGTIPFVPLTPTLPRAPSTIATPTPPTAATAAPPITAAPITAAPTTAPPTTAAPTTAAPTTAAPTTLPPTTTSAKTGTTLVFVPLPPTTAPRVAVSPLALIPQPPLPQTSIPQVSTTSASPTTTPGRIPVGPFPTIDVRPVTESRTPPPLPTGAGTPVPTTAPFTTEPKTYTFIAATEPAPPVHPQAALVVETAKALLGAAYVWGGEGPGYDCSGLSLVAWRAAGVNLAHQSRAQFAATTRVNLADVAIGDLLFYGDPIHHLGIYIGDGKMIEAPRAGINVRITSIKRRDLIGIGRVTS